MDSLKPGGGEVLVLCFWQRDRYCHQSVEVLQSSLTLGKIAEGTQLRPLQNPPPSSFKPLSHRAQEQGGVIPPSGLAKHAAISTVPNF